MARETPRHITHLGFVCLLDFEGHLDRVAWGGPALLQPLGLTLGLASLGLQLAQLPGRVHQPLQLQVDGAAIRGQGHGTALWCGSSRRQDSHHTRAGQCLHVARHCRRQGARGLVGHFQETCGGERTLRPGSKETDDSGAGAPWGPEAHSRA